MTEDQAKQNIQTYHDYQKRFNDWWWSQQSPEVQQFRNIDDLSKRKDLALQLEKQGISVPDFAVSHWNPLERTVQLKDYGYTWIPSVGGEPIRIAPGLSMPGMEPYDPNNPPPRSTLLTTPDWFDMDEYRRLRQAYDTSWDVVAQNQRIIPDPTPTQPVTPATPTIPVTQIPATPAIPATPTLPIPPAPVQPALRTPDVINPLTPNLGGFRNFGGFDGLVNVAPFGGFGGLSPFGGFGGFGGFNPFAILGMNPFMRLGAFNPFGGFGGLGILGGFGGFRFNPFMNFGNPWALNTSRLLSALQPFAMSF